MSETKNIAENELGKDGNKTGRFTVKFTAGKVDSETPESPAEPSSPNGKIL